MRPAPTSTPPPSASPEPARPRRAGRRLLAAAAGLLAVFLVATYLLFVSPAADSHPGPADAVVVLGNFDGRLSRGLELIDEGAAPVLVVSGGEDDICDVRAGYEVRCPVPEPFSTQGEARMVRRLAAEEGWESIIVVTSTHHITRARLLFDRCFDGDVQMADAGTTYDRGHRPMKILHEWGGLGHALISRGC